MPTFQYKGFKEFGESAKGIIEANDIKDARERLAQRGILSESIKAASEINRQKSKFDISTRSMLYRELASLLKAGLGLDQAFEILLQTPEFQRYTGVIGHVRDQLREGKTMSLSFSSSNAAVSSFESSLMNAGERTGKLPEMLMRIADFLEEEQHLREQTLTAFFYPGLVFFLGLAVTALMLGLVLPRFEKLLSGMSLELPLMTRMFLAIGSFMTSYGIFFVLFLLILIFIGWKHWNKDPTFRILVEKKAPTIPVLGNAWKALMNMRFARTLALLIEGGIPIPESLRLSGEATGSYWLAKNTLEKVKVVQDGASLADATGRLPVLGETLPGWIRAGEASGELVPMLENAATRFQRNWEKRIARFIALLEPAMIIIIGLFVLLVALSVLQPVLSLNDVLQN